MRAAQRGLTLLEALVALALMALIGVASYQVLTATVMTRDAQARHRHELAQWQRALSIMQRDIEQAQPRAVRGSGADPVPAWLLSEADSQLELTSGGRRNPLLLAQSPLIRVRYRVDLHPLRDREEHPHYRDEQRYLLREVWFNIDGPRTDPADLVQALLPEPDGLAIEVLSERGRHRQWPLRSNPGSASPTAQAILVSLEYPRQGTVQRWFALDSRPADEGSHD